MYASCDDLHCSVGYKRVSVSLCVWFTWLRVAEYSGLTGRKGTALRSVTRVLWFWVVSHTGGTNMEQKIKLCVCACVYRGAWAASLSTHACIPIQTKQLKTMQKLLKLFPIIRSYALSPPPCGRLGVCMRVFVSLPLTCGASVRKDYLTANATEENGEKEQEKRKSPSKKSAKEEEKDSTRLSGALPNSISPPPSCSHSNLPSSMRPIFIFSTLDFRSTARPSQNLFSPQFSFFFLLLFASSQWCL